MIKKIVILIIGLVFLTSTVNALPIVMKTECDLLAPDGVTHFSAIGKEVIKINDKVTITCKGTLPAEITRPENKVHFDYANTGIYYQTDQYEINTGLTSTWKEVIKPNGIFILKVTVDLKPVNLKDNDLKGDDLKNDDLKDDDMKGDDLKDDD